jgi:hypothetical protein
MSSSITKVIVLGDDSDDELPPVVLTSVSTFNTSASTFNTSTVNEEGGKAKDYSFGKKPVKKGKHFSMVEEDFPTMDTKITTSALKSCWNSVANTNIGDCADINIVAKLDIPPVFRKSRQTTVAQSIKPLLNNDYGIDGEDEEDDDEEEEEEEEEGEEDTGEMNAELGNDCDYKHGLW